MGCNKEFNIRELRDHLWTCTARSDEDEDDVSYDRNEEPEDLNIIDPVDNTSDTANGTTNMIPNMDVQQSAAASNPDNTEARDLGGPRKEFFTEVLREIHDKYFENGLKQHLEEDYKTVGVIMGLSTLQNGRIPQFMGEEVRQELFQSPFPSPCIEQLRQGFDKLGICKVWYLATRLPYL
ncbi:uncharacterized protein [Ptychodera flava]|uniref:uncharacterized protein n=1 Tax=Ptychodera flava TaxID=63121 RepID=UPI00396A50D7